MILTAARQFVADVIWALDNYVRHTAAGPWVAGGCALLGGSLATVFWVLYFTRNREAWANLGARRMIAELRSRVIGLEIDKAQAVKREAERSAKVRAAKELLDADTRK